MTTGEFFEAKITMPEGTTRCDFGFTFGRWTCWIINDLRWYVGKGDTIEDANAQAIMNFNNGIQIGRMKELRQAEKPRELDGRTREGKYIKSNNVTPLSTQDLKDMF